MVPPKGLRYFHILCLDYIDVTRWFSSLQKVKTRLFGHSLTPNDQQLGRIHLDFCETICALDVHPGLRASGGKNRIEVGPDNLWGNQGLLILPPPLVQSFGSHLWYHLLVATLIPPFSKTAWHHLGTGNSLYREWCHPDEI